ncbi:MAG TPA: DUF1566 domain-containing protein [Polyangiales bacterium]|nr:DUF1566 domain-containing protein [Polyangiales bacterium]
MNSAASPPVSQDVCANSICAADYPCTQLGTNYTCRGQFADWTPAYSEFNFVDNRDGTISDKRSGLTWQRDITVSFAPTCNARIAAQSQAADSCTWMQALSYCATLDLAGTGWRLPTRAELESIVNSSRTMPAVDVNVFPDTLAQWFWTSSPKVHSTDSAWIIDFSDGSANYKPKTNALRVRCVR